MPVIDSGGSPGKTGPFFVLFTLSLKRYMKPMFIAALFTIARYGNNMCPLIGGWILKMWYIYKILAIKKQ